MKKIVKSLCVLGALVLSVTVSANKATWSATSLNSISSNSFVTTFNHGSFTLAPAQGSPAISYEKPLFGDGKLKIGEWRTGTYHYTLSWSCNEGSTVKVTKITLSMNTYGGTTGGRSAMTKLGANGEEKDIHDMIGIYVDVTSNSADLNGNSIDLSVNRTGFDDTRAVYIKSITFEYTITPDAPVLGDTKTAEVDVTIDGEDPNTVALAGLFSAKDHYGESLKYEAVPAGNAVISNDAFYALAAGEYKVFAYVDALKDCHEKSAASADSLVITVNRVAATLEVRDSAEVSATVNEGNKHMVDMMEHIYFKGDALSFEIFGENASEATIAPDSMFYARKAGEYKVAIKSVESPRYLASEEADTLVINVTMAEVKMETELKEDNEMVIEDEIEDLFNLADTLGMTITIEPQGVIEYDAENNTLSAIGAGEATLTLHQDAVPGVVAGLDTTFNFAVSKKANAFIIELGDFVGTEITLPADTVIAIYIDTENDELGSEFTIVYEQGSDLVDIKHAESIFESDSLMTLGFNGVAKLTLHQDETDMYEAADSSIVITIEGGETPTGMRAMKNIVKGNKMIRRGVMVIRKGKEMYNAMGGKME